MLAELFVSFGAKDAGLNAVIDGLHSKLDKLQSKFNGIGLKAAAGFAAGAGALTLFARAALEGDTASEKLRIALQANGEEVTQNLAAFSDLADHLKEITVFDDDAIKGAMALALNMGITGDQLEQVTKAGVGLASVFGGDLDKGMKAAAAAAQGNYKQLRALIPEMASLSDEEAKARIGQLMAMGFQEAQLEAQTLGGKLKQLGNALGDVAKGIGKELLPIIGAVTTVMRKLADGFNALGATTKRWVAIGLLVATALAGIIAVLPLIIGFVSTLVTVIGAVLSPIGLTVAAIAALAAGIMYAAGTGDTFAARMESGFFKVVAVVANIAGAIVRIFAASNKAILEGVQFLLDKVLGALAYFGHAIDDAFGGGMGAVLDDAMKKVDDFFGKIKDKNEGLDSIGKSLWGADGEALQKKVEDFIAKLKGGAGGGGSEDLGDMPVGDKASKEKNPKKGKTSQTLSATDFLSANVTARALGNAQQSDYLRQQIDALEAQKRVASNTKEIDKKLARAISALEKINTGYQ